MLIRNILSIFCVIFFPLLQKAFAIMVPTGKVGPITPKKYVPEVMPPKPYKEPAQVWERVDEGPNPPQPPVYKYTLLDYARKYGRKTLIPPPEDEYYKPPPRMLYYRKRQPIYIKTNYYISPLQLL